MKAKSHPWAESSYRADYSRQTQSLINSKENWPQEETHYSLYESTQSGSGKSGKFPLAGRWSKSNRQEVRPQIITRSDYPEPLPGSKGQGWLLTLSGHLDILDTFSSLSPFTLPSEALRRLVLSQSLFCSQSDAMQKLKLKGHSLCPENFTSLQVYKFNIADHILCSVTCI